MTIDTYMHDTGPKPFYTTVRLYFIQSIVGKQFSDGCPNPFYNTLRLYFIQSIVCKQFSDSL